MSDDYDLPEGYRHLYSGKVRDLYEAPNGQLLFIASDRISAYDWVLPTPIPDKGRILTQLSLWWFNRLQGVVPNHLVSTQVPKSVRGRAMLCEPLEMMPVECVVRGVPPGLGEPAFDRLEADLAKGVLSLPATKGFEIGSGFQGTTLRGSEHNDAFFMEQGRVRTRTNRSGGVQGGISNGEAIVFRVAFKPTATIFQTQATVSPAGQDVELKARGRHDACVLPRAVPMVEAMTVLVLTDHMLRQRAQNG